MKLQYQKPVSLIIPVIIDLMQHLSMGAGTTPSPGGGAAKSSHLDEWEEDSWQEVEDFDMVNYKPWQ